MPRALSREEQLVLNAVRRHEGPITVPDLATGLALSPDTVQQICVYLVERQLLSAAIYAVTAVGTRAGAARPVGAGAG
jgi:hypothetical protein